MAVQYAPLFSLETQFQAKDGSNNTAGWLKVYLAATDDPAETYSDYLGTRNPEKIVLDDNGRAVVICDKAKAYRLEVYDADGMLLWTEEPVYCSGTGGGGISVTEVVSTDGSIAVESSVAGSMRTYDLSIAPSDSDEFLEWIKCSEEDCGSTWYPVYQSGTMETEAGQGIKVHGGHLYHFTNTFYVDPDGTGITYSTFQVNMYCNGGIVDSRNFDIDTSVNDSVQCEFSTDVIPEADGYVYFTLTVPSGCEVTGEVQCHRIYSGINAVPDTCATKQWVEQNISSKIDYSALEYNQQNLITGISGSAIAANSVDPNEFIPWSASGAFQPSGDYLTATASSLFQPSGDYLTATASSLFQPSGNYVYESAFSSYSSVIDNSITAISSVVSGVSSTYIEKTASGMFQPSGDYVSSTDMSAYVPFSGLDMSAGKITAISGTALSAGKVYTGVNPVWVDNTADQIGVYNKTLAVDETMTAYESGNSAVIGVNTAILSGYAKASSLEDYQLKSAMTAYASVEYVDSAVSGKLDVTASSQFLTSLPDGLAYTSDVASAVSGKLDASASSEFYPMTENPAGYLTAHQSLAGYATVEYVDSSVSGKLDATAYNSAQFILTSQSGMFQASGEYLSASESSNYYSTANPSGFISGVDLTPYQLTADMSAYQPSGDYQTAGNYLSSTDSAEFLLTSQSGLFQPSGNYQPSGDYLSATESANYQLTANMTGYIPVSALGTGEI